MTVREAVSATRYPGRGILIGKSDAGDRAYLAYFIMGRSENSKNRVFETTEDGIRTRAFDPAKLRDPSLIIYAPVRRIQNQIIVTNGDQTDTVRDFLLQGKGFRAALDTRTYEPDAPNYTPRVSALVTLSGGDFSLDMSILKAYSSESPEALRAYWRYDRLPSGAGCYLHTYLRDGTPIPSFSGDPERVTLGSDFDAFGADIWDGLDAEYKVSLWTQEIDLQSGEALHTRLRNQQN